jgi:hypothetical protein
MEELKIDYFCAICDLVRAKQPVDIYGIDDILLRSINWFLNAPIEYSELIYMRVREDVLNARLCY